jgi:hypothetical protein
VEEISLTDSLPFLDQSQGNRRDLFLEQMKEQARSQLQNYFEEL